MIIKYCTKSFPAQTRGDEQESFSNCSFRVEKTRPVQMMSISNCDIWNSKGTFSQNGNFLVRFGTFLYDCELLNMVSPCSILSRPGRRQGCSTKTIWLINNFVITSLMNWCLDGMLSAGRTSHNLNWFIIGNIRWWIFI